MKTILYAQHVKLPDEVRAEKVCGALANAGYRVVVLSRWFPGMAEREEYQNYIVARAGYKQKPGFLTPYPYNPYWRAAIQRAASEFQPDCIIAREILIADGAISAANKRDIPVLLDMAEHYPAAMRGWKKYQKSYLGRLATNTLHLPDLIEKKTVNMSDGIIVVCGEQSERLSAQYNFPQKDIAIVHNTPHLSAYIEMRNDFTKNTVFAHHGYCTMQRNLSVFLQGFELVATHFANIEVDIVGGGESETEISAIVKKLKNRIRFSPVEYKLSELPHLIEKSNIGIVPYADDDFINNTISNKVFDYMAAGRPLFTSLAKPLKRIIDETNAGIAWDCSTPTNVAAGLEYMLKCDLKAMSENGKRWAKEKYNWSVDGAVLTEFVGRWV